MALDYGYYYYAVNNDDLRMLVAFLLVAVGMIAMLMLGYWLGSREVKAREPIPPRWPTPTESPWGRGASSGPWSATTEKQPGQVASETPPPPATFAANSKRAWNLPSTFDDACGVCYRHLRCDHKVTSCPFVEVSTS